MCDVCMCVCVSMCQSVNMCDVNVCVNHHSQMMWMWRVGISMDITHTLTHKNCLSHDWQSTNSINQSIEICVYLVWIWGLHTTRVVQSDSGVTPISHVNPPANCSYMWCHDVRLSGSLVTRDSDWRMSCMDVIAVLLFKSLLYVIACWNNNGFVLCFYFLVIFVVFVWKW